MMWTATSLITLLGLLLQQPFDAAGRPNRQQPAPWENDVVVYRVGRTGTS